MKYFNQYSNYVNILYSVYLAGTQKNVNGFIETINAICNECNNYKTNINACKGFEYSSSALETIIEQLNNINSKAEQVLKLAINECNELLLLLKQLEEENKKLDAKKIQLNVRRSIFNNTPRNITKTVQDKNDEGEIVKKTIQVINQAYFKLKKELQQLSYEYSILDKNCKELCSQIDSIISALKSLNDGDLSGASSIIASRVVKQVSDVSTLTEMTEVIGYEYNHNLMSEEGVSYSKYVPVFSDGNKPKRVILYFPGSQSMDTIEEINGKKVKKYGSPSYLELMLGDSVDENNVITYNNEMRQRDNYYTTDAIVITIRGKGKKDVALFHKLVETIHDEYGISDDTKDIVIGYSHGTTYLPEYIKNYGDTIDYVVSGGTTKNGLKGFENPDVIESVKENNLSVTLTNVTNDPNNKEFDNLSKTLKDDNPYNMEKISSDTKMPMINVKKGSSNYGQVKEGKTGGHGPYEQYVVIKYLPLTPSNNDLASSETLN